MLGKRQSRRHWEAHLVVQGCEGTQAQATSEDDPPGYSGTEMFYSGVPLCFRHAWVSTMSNAVVMVNGYFDMYPTFRAS